MSVFIVGHAWIQKLQVLKLIVIKKNWKSFIHIFMSWLFLGTQY